MTASTLPQTTHPHPSAATAADLRLRVRWGRLTLLLLAVLALFLLSLALGSVAIPLDEVLRVLTGGEASRDSWSNIILRIRLPRTLTALLAGAALGVSGLHMQTFFRNPLADPFVLGVSSGASLGVALVVLVAGSVGGVLLTGLGLLGDLGITAAAALGGGAVLVVVMLAARRVQHSVTLLIVGLMFGYLTGAIVSLLMYFALPERVQAYIQWSFGTFGGVTWGQMPVFVAAIVLGLILAGGLAKPLNALLLGEVYARSMGVEVRRLRVLVIAASALLAGTVTAFCGPIGFLGIAVPHLCRGLFRTADHRTLIPAALLMGGLCALAAALIAELPGSTLVLPLNAVTALFGAPVVLLVILRGKTIGRG